MAQNLSIMLVEDEPLIAMMLEDFLESLGHSVATTCDAVDAALEWLENGKPDLAILDVNVSGQAIWPVAEVLADRGVPIALATGGHVTDPPERFVNTPTLAKPFTIDRVEPVIAEAIAHANA